MQKRTTSAKYILSGVKHTEQPERRTL